MAGGTWTNQNKIRPGVYINFTSEAKALGTVSERGVVTVGLPLSWGEPKSVIAIQAGDNVKELLGYDAAAPELRLVSEAFKRAETLLLYRLNTGTKASVTAGDLTVTARYGGIRGNDIGIVIAVNADDSALYDVTTLVDGKAVDVQSAADIASLAANSWVVFSGTGALAVTAGAALTGGADGVVTNADHTDYLAAIEVYDFNTIALVSTEQTLKSVYKSFVKRLREDEGRKVQAVVENYPGADYEGVISVKNGVVLADGTQLTAAKAAVWVAAATAGAQMNESLTYQAYDDAVDVDIRYSNSQIEAALRAGEMVFVHNNGRAIVEQDLNTLTGFTPDKNKSLSKNRVIRVLDGIANDLKDIFEAGYIGRVNNNADGRNIFRNEIISYLNTLQASNAIQNFDAQNDVVVEAGVDTDVITVNLNVQPVDSIEKIYMKVMVG